MTIPSRDSEAGVCKPLRLAPGVAAVTLQWLGWLLLPVVVPDGGAYGMIAGVAGGLLVFVWWLFFSRAPWTDRFGAIALMMVAVLVTYRLVHPSVANAGMGMMLVFLAIPAFSLALVASAAIGRHLPSGRRRGLMAGAILIACGAFTLIRTGGISGDGDADIHWRWTKTAEERLLAQEREEPIASALPAAAPAPPPAPPATPAVTDAAPAAAEQPRATPAAVPARSAESGVAAAVEGSDPADARAGAEWPGFRGPARDGVVRGVRIETDWSRTPPVELWRRPIGPGWSSFAVSGDLIYTQEQRGEHEVVSCYRLTTGEPVWRHRDPVRFYESNGGPGPRATPTVHEGRIYTLGATGIVNALDAKTGARAWSRNAATDTGKAVPDWGFAGSPSVVGDLVIIAVAGQLIAYDARDGKPRWTGEPGGGGYSSPHPATIEGVPQVLLIRGSRTISVRPEDGVLLWEHTWERAGAILQPALVGGSDVLIALGDAMGMGGLGMRRLAVTRSSGGWTLEERWTSRGLKPYFNDFVVHRDHAFGFDGSILAAIDLSNGERKWKGGRYGHGQMLLLADSDVLLVLSEDGELALVGAVPDRFTELARFSPLEGKTWNHPVLAGDVLLVRNGEQMAAFRLPLAPPEPAAR